MESNRIARVHPINTNCWGIKNSFYSCSVSSELPQSKFGTYCTHPKSERRRAFILYSSQPLLFFVITQILLATNGCLNLFCLSLYLVSSHAITNGFLKYNPEPVVPKFALYTNQEWHHVTEDVLSKLVLTVELL